MSGGLSSKFTDWFILSKKKIFGSLMGMKFASKCKSSTEKIIARVELMRKRRQAMQRFLKNDIAELLRKGLESNAYIRAEELLAGLNQLECYDFIDHFCGWISEHLSVMNEERGCPKEWWEAVSSLVYAAARMADVPELRKLRNVLTERYGKHLETFVNQEFAEKLRSKSSPKDAKLQLLRDIAREYSVEWDSKVLEQRLFNSPAINQVSTCCGTRIAFYIAGIHGDRKRKPGSKDANGDRHESREKKGDNVERGVASKEDDGGLSLNREKKRPDGDGCRPNTVAIKKDGEDWCPEAPESLPNRLPVREIDSKNQNPFYCGAVPPPYSRSKAGNYGTGSVALPVRSDGSEVPLHFLAQSKDVGEGENNPVTEATLKGRSVRSNGAVPPPYSRPEAGKYGTTSEALSGGSDGNGVPTDFPAQSKNIGEGENDSKLKPGSVRRRGMKQSPGHDPGYPTAKTNPNRIRQNRSTDSKRPAHGVGEGRVSISRKEPVTPPSYPALERSRKEEKYRGNLVAAQSKGPVTKAKLKPRSVRRTGMKQTPGHDLGHSTVKTIPNKMRAEDRRRIHQNPADKSALRVNRGTNTKHPAHVHHKLPDYDDIVAFFTALKRE